MEIFQFDRREKNVGRFGSRGFFATRIAAGDGQMNLTCLTLEPNGLIGTHPATSSQLFLVISGEGWVAGPMAGACRSHPGGAFAGMPERSTPAERTPALSPSQ